MWPWLDRTGRLSPLKLVAFLALLVPAAWIAAALLAGALGPRPLTEAIRECGLWTIRWLFVGLAITPLAAVFACPPLFMVRRMAGVAAAAYAFAHLGLYTADQAFDLAAVASEILRRIYLTIGCAALLGLSALAATSTDAMVRRLGGRNWRRLHRLVYAIAVLAVLHFFLQSKLDEWEPTVMAGLLLWLLLWLFLYRALEPALPRRGGMPLAAFAGLGVAAALATALGEALYFRVAMGVDPLRVLAVNLSLATGLRPAVVVFVTTLALSAAVGLRHRLARWGRGRPQFERVPSSSVGFG